MSSGTATPPDRNPFDEYECGHWYARALASYGMLQGLTGVPYDAVAGVLTLALRVPGDVRAFLATATGFGIVGVKEGEPFVEVKQGTIPYEDIAYTPYNQDNARQTREAINKSSLVCLHKLCYFCAGNHPCPRECGGLSQPLSRPRQITNPANTTIPTA